MADDEQRSAYDVLQMGLADLRRTLLRAGMDVPARIAFGEHQTWNRVRQTLPLMQTIDFDSEPGAAIINICGIDCVFSPQFRAHPNGKVTAE